MKPITSIRGHYEILKILQIALFRNVFQKRKQFFHRWILFIFLTRCELDRVTIEMRHSNSFTHEPLWVMNVHRLGFCYLSLTGIYKLKYERKIKEDSGPSSKMTSSCKWSIDQELFFQYSTHNYLCA